MANGEEGVASLIVNGRLGLQPLTNLASARLPFTTTIILIAKRRVSNECSRNEKDAGNFFSLIAIVGNDDRNGLYCFQCKIGDL
jgi:hypothetical protein